MRTAGSGSQRLAFAGKGEISLSSGTEIMKVGFIGLGTMGSLMAGNLQKAGHQLVVNDLRRTSAEPCLTDGAVWAGTPEEIARQTEVVFSSLPGPAEVEEVALGAQGILCGIRSGGSYFDLSTNAPSVARRINAAFAEKHAYMLDAPVSGGPAGAATGKARAVGER